MQNLFNQAKSQALKVGEYFTPVATESKFREAGVLTPAEFIAAGDHLVHHCPSWQWSAAADDAHTRDYLPKDKQFLITRNVPCYKRCKQMMNYSADREKVLQDDEGGWVDTHHFGGPEGEDDLASAAKEMTLEDEEEDEAGAKKEAVAASEDGGDDSDQEALDMDDFIDKGMMEAEAGDKGAVAVKNTEDKEVKKAGKGGEIVATRTYDLNITYDKFYQTPRLWLFGYDENKKELKVEEMYEDFSADHANKTITMETHPHLPGPPQASVHPCRHAQTMKKLVDQIMEGGKELGVHMYIIVFLKFVQAIIPTIEYDFTQNFAL